jgi:ABC-type multidrug transport system fused ATPase/permease subunit
MGFFFVGQVGIIYSQYLLQDIVQAFQNSDISRVWSIFIWIIVSFLAGRLFSQFGAQIFTNVRGIWSAMNRMRELMFAHLQELDFAFHTNKSSGYLMSQISK